MLFWWGLAATGCCLLIPLGLAGQTAQEADSNAAAGKCVFAGVVRDSLTGQPLAKATVNLSPRDPGEPSYTTSTDAEGAFRFEAPDAGDYGNGSTLKCESTTADHTGNFASGDLAPSRSRLFAIQGFEEGPRGSPELVEALAEKSAVVELQDGRSATVNLPVISPEEWEAALRKVGM